MATSSEGAEIPIRPIEPAFALIEQIQTAGLGQQVQVRDNCKWCTFLRPISIGQSRSFGLGLHRGPCTDPIDAEPRWSRSSTHYSRWTIQG